MKPKRLPDGSLKTSDASNNSLALAINHINTTLQVKFDRSCLKQQKVIFTHKKVVTNYIAYEINLWSYTEAVGFTSKNSLFEAGKLTKDAYPDKCK